MGVFRITIWIQDFFFWAALARWFFTILLPTPRIRLAFSKCFLFALFVQVRKNFVFFPYSCITFKSSFPLASFKIYSWMKTFENEKACQWYHVCSWVKCTNISIFPWIMAFRRIGDRLWSEQMMTRVFLKRKCSAKTTWLNKMLPCTRCWI